MIIHLGMALAAASTPRKRRKKDISPDKVTSRTRMGARGIRKNDVVRVRDPRDDGETFAARVTGGYTLDGQWMLQLGALPPARHVLRQSTQARNVIEHWARTGDVRA